MLVDSFVAFVLSDPEGICVVCVCVRFPAPGCDGVQDLV